MTSPNNEGLDLAETRLQEAVRDADVEALEDLLDPEVVFVAPDGTEVTKDADLDAHRSGTLRILALTELSRSVKGFGDAGTSRVVLHLVGRSNGTDFDAKFAYTRTWRREGERWRVVQAQGAVIGQR